MSFISSQSLTLLFWLCRYDYTTILMQYCPVWNTFVYHYCYIYMKELHIQVALSQIVCIPDCSRASPPTTQHTCSNVLGCILLQLHYKVCQRNGM